MFPASIAPSAAPAPMRVCKLVDEEDDAPLRLLDFLQDGLEPLLELAAELRAGHHGAEIERDDALVLQGLGDVPGHDAPGEPFDDGGLADARIPDQDRVVLRPPREDLHDPADLVVAADDGVELPSAGELGQVARVALERLVFLIGGRVGHAGRAADLLEGREERGFRESVLREELRRGRPSVPDEREEEMLGGDVVVAELAGDLLGEIDELHERRREPRFVSIARDAREPGERGLRGLPRRPGPRRRSGREWPAPSPPPARRGRVRGARASARDVLPRARVGPLAESLPALSG